MNGTLKRVKSSLWVASSVSGLIGLPELLKTNFCLAFFSMDATFIRMDSGCVRVTCFYPDILTGLGAHSICFLFPCFFSVSSFSSSFPSLLRPRPFLFFSRSFFFLRTLWEVIFVVAICSEKFKVCIVGLICREKITSLAEKSDLI